ncbi:fimbrial protein [Jeongeupia sp. USM3]|uniref:fimbrial protein n=1 Tax=Jeongeupia sp. USM3 TaxID=1906741 RepID=UPI00089DF8C0|nr:fimbrial protein [Jeongeupia sp. USM3]AOX99421.1 fimbrial protein [Jeongeupia sp. USM3]
MKKFAFAAAALSIIPALTFAASANTINFQGEVADQTCSVTINGNATTPMVLLPTVPASQLAASGSTAGQTPFTVGLTGCTAPASALSVKTVFVGNNLNTGNRLGNTGSATNVSLELVDPATPATPLDLTGQTGAAGLVLAAGATSASHDFAVRYYAEGAATAGSVLGSVQYAVSYQ